MYWFSIAPGWLGWFVFWACEASSNLSAKHARRHGWIPNGYNGCCIPQASFAWSNANTPTEIQRDCTLGRYRVFSKHTFHFHDPIIGAPSRPTGTCHG